MHACIIVSHLMGPSGGGVGWGGRARLLAFDRDTMVPLSCNYLYLSSNS